MNESVVVVEIKPNKNGKFEFSEFENLMLNMMGGLRWENLTDDEKTLCRANGYDPEKK